MPTMLYDATKQKLKTGDNLPCGDLVSVFPKDSPVIVVETSAVKPRHGKAKSIKQSNSITRSTKKTPKTKAGDRKLSVTKVCAFCGKPFTPKRSDAVVCSGGCRVAQKRAKDRQGKLL